MEYLNPRNNSVGTEKCRGGFTIIEFIIATLVFSVLLLVLTTGILQVTHSYYKGIIETNTQDTARSMVESIGQAVQFSKDIIRESCQGSACSPMVGCNTPPSLSCTGGVICIGNTSYSFILYKKLTPALPNGVVRQNTYTSANTANCPLSAPPGPYSLTTGNELMGQNMRLVKLDMYCTTGVFDTTASDCQNGLYTIDARVAYGDDDLLCSPTASDNDCNPTVVPTVLDLQRPDLICKEVTGEQFCAVAEVSSEVQRRLVKLNEHT